MKVNAKGHKWTAVSFLSFHFGRKGLTPIQKNTPAEPTQESRSRPMTPSIMDDFINAIRPNLVSYLNVVLANAL